MTKLNVCNEKLETAFDTIAILEAQIKTLQKELRESLALWEALKIDMRENQPDEVLVDTVYDFIKDVGSVED